MTAWLSILPGLTVTGSILVLAVLLLRYLFKAQMPKRFVVILWLLTFAAFLIPVRIPAPAFMIGIQANITLPSIQALQPVTKKEGISASSAENPIKSGRQTQQPSGNAQVGRQKPQAERFTFLYVAAVIESGISAVLMILFTILYLFTVRRLRQASPIKIRAFDDLQRQLGIRRRIRLYQSENTGVPVTAGVLRSKIFLPADFDFNRRELTAHICLHELIHVRRYDNAVSLTTLYIACLHWFNPLVWVAYSMLCRDMELACDATAVRIPGYHKRSEYAQSLLFMAGENKKIRPMLLTAWLHRQYICY